jgi:isopenicillin-N N-acyltransferase like protein
MMQEKKMEPFNLNMLTLSGTPLERGQMYGESLRTKINENIDYLLQLLLNKNGQEADEAIAQVLAKTGFEASIARWAPQLLEEIHGIAEGANRPFPTLLALQLVDGLVGLKAELACSTVGIWGQSGMPTLLAQTADNMNFWSSHRTLLHIIYPDSDLEVYTMTFSGILGVYGLNNYGIGVCVNALGEVNTAPDGLTCPIVARCILEQASFKDAVQFMHSVKFSSGNHYAIGGPEKVSSFECSANQIAEYIPPDAATRLFHTNHVLANTDKIPTQNFNPEMQENLHKGLVNTQTRQATLEEYLKDPAKRVTVEDIKDTLCTHGRHPICSHGEGGATTNYTTIMELSNDPVLHLAPGPGCKTAFWKFKF